MGRGAGSRPLHLLAESAVTCLLYCSGGGRGRSQIYSASTLWGRVLNPANLYRDRFVHCNPVCNGALLYLCLSVVKKGEVGVWRARKARPSEDPLQLKPAPNTGAGNFKCVFLTPERPVFHSPRLNCVQSTNFLRIQNGFSNSLGSYLFYITFDFQFTDLLIPQLHHHVYFLISGYLYFVMPPS